MVEFQPDQPRMDNNFLRSKKIDLWWSFGNGDIS